MIHKVVESYIEFGKTISTIAGMKQSDKYKERMEIYKNFITATTPEK